MPALIRLFLLTCLLWPAATRAEPAASAPAVTQQQAADALAVLRDPQKREQFTATLEAIAHAQSAAAADTKPGLVPNSLGVQVLDQVTAWAGRLQDQVSNTSHTLGDLPLLGLWVERTAADPAARARVGDAAWKLILVIGCGLAAEALAWRAARRPVAMIEAHAPDGAVPEDGAEDAVETTADRAARHRLRLGLAWRLLRKLPLMIARAVLDLLPVAVFVLVANLLLGSPIGTPLATRLVIAQAVNAYAVVRLLMVLTRLLVLPSCDRLRLLRLSDEAAAYIERWVRRIAAVVVFGNAFAQAALALGLYRAAQDEVFKLVMLVAHVMLVIVVLQCRQSVARRLRPRRNRHGLVPLLLTRLAEAWYRLAIFYIVASWVVWAVEVRNGLSRLTHFFLVTVAVVIVARVIGIVLLGGLYRSLHVSPEVAARYPGLEARAGRYMPLLRGTVTAALFALTGVALLQVWGLDALSWFRRGVGGQLLSAALTVLVTILLAVVTWEAANAAMDRQAARLETDGQLLRVARLRTLVPILRTTLLVAILAVIGLTVLSEIGVNVAPLLAGAGILGVALGFGSQKLVQDLITGLFLLLENAMQVGDTVTVSGLSGVVEHLSIRTIRLRAGDGSVHIIPFSAVSSVTNTNRGLANAAVSVIVSGDEDTDRVGEALKAIALEMREDPEYGPKITSDLQLWGVDKLDGATATVVGQIACIDTGRWGVQREYNRRVGKRFRELGIRLALPAQAVVLQDMPALGPPAAHGAADPGPSAATQADSPAPSALGHGG